jgi:carbonic anhydrase
MTRPSFLNPFAPFIAARRGLRAALICQGLSALLLCTAAAASDTAAPNEGVALDKLRDRLAERVAAVRDAQARTPVLKVSVKADKPPKPSAHAARAAPGHGDAKPGAGAHATGHAHWSYQGDAGPAAWASLKPEFASCGTGQRQSPIDIRDGIKVDLEAVNYDYRPSSFGVIDNGHTVQVNVAPGNSIDVAGRRYELLQFHFHRPSEERINGRQFDMVVHLVHKDPQGRLAVVAVLLQQGRQHPLVQLVWNSLPLEQNEEVSAPVPLDLNLLLPEDRRYYTYMGSLTTPPCSEGVLWMVLKQPVQLSPEQVAVFARLYPMNARPIQQASGRMIKESN